MRRALMLMMVLSTGCHRVSFEVDGERLIMNGTFNTKTPDALRTVLEDNPGLTIAEMVYVPGSVDDVACLKAGRLAREHGLSTLVPANGEIASGGVDFFLSGVQRTVESGGLVGVHSWSQFGGPDGSELPRDDPEHTLYLDYLEEMGIDEAFYWFTLEAAAPEDIHWMTDKELVSLGVVTP